MVSGIGRQAQGSVPLVWIFDVGPVGLGFPYMHVCKHASNRSQW